MSPFLADYAPWKEDKEFLEAYYKVKDHTLIDVYRLYILWSLVEQAAKLNTGNFLEVGVWKGGSAALISMQMASCNAVDRYLYACDTFKGVVKAGDRDPIYKGGEHEIPESWEVENFINSFNLPEVTILEGVFPDKTGGYLFENEFCFCHIDVDVYQSAKDVFTWIWPRLVSGGIIVFDDYGFSQCAGVTTFVNDIKTYSGNVFMYNLSGQAIVIKL